MLRSLGAEPVSAALQTLAAVHEPSRVANFLRAIQKEIRGAPISDPAVQHWTGAAAIILYSGPEKGGGVSNLVEVILRSPITRPAAANAFFIVGTNHPSILPDLEKCLADPRLEVRQFCIEAIARMAPWAHPLFPVLTNFVHDPDPILSAYASGIVKELNRLSMPAADATE